MQNGRVMAKAKLPHNMFCCDGAGTRTDTVDKTFEFVLLSQDAKPPMRGTSGSAALDLYNPHRIILPPMSTVKVPLDIALKPPVGTYTRTVSRSGMAVHDQLFIPADCIDPDYTGCIHVCLTNLSNKAYVLSKHERVASIVFEKYEHADGQQVKKLPTTNRKNAGFGSTGKR
jgi:dUTP pyrophosphatase